MNDGPLTRRPISIRDAAWSKSIAAWLARHRIAPNAISAASMVFAGISGTALALWSHFDSWAICLLISAAACIQLRLLCNLFDGMVAIEWGQRSSTGELWNEVPDRIADSLILVGAGYGIHDLPGGIELGWLGALLAMATAYVRALGASLGASGLFMGPMAKQHRMALMTIACLTAAATATAWDSRWIIWGCLVLVAVGSAVTILRRLAATATLLQRRP